MPNYCPECGDKLVSPKAEICPNCGVRLKVNSKKSPGLAAFASLLFAGLGQVYNGNPGRGILIYVGTYLGLLALIIPGLAVFIYGIYDAYVTAKRMNTGEIPYEETNALHMVLFMVFYLVGIVVFLAIVAVLASVTFTHVIR